MEGEARDSLTLTQDQLDDLAAVFQSASSKHAASPLHVLRDSLHTATGKMQICRCPDVTPSLTPT